MKTLKKSTLEKIEKINSLIVIVDELNLIPYTYNGGTFPHYVLIKPIKIKNHHRTAIQNNFNCSSRFIAMSYLVFLYCHRLLFLSCCCYLITKD
jgi:hypothetical protein